jgi:hypothetical protein
MHSNVGGSAERHAHNCAAYQGGCCILHMHGSVQFGNGILCIVNRGYPTTEWYLVEYSKAYAQPLPCHLRPPKGLCPTLLPPTTPTGPPSAAAPGSRTQAGALTRRPSLLVGPWGDHALDVPVSLKAFCTATQCIELHQYLQQYFHLELPV